MKTDINNSKTTWYLYGKVQNIMTAFTCSSDIIPRKKTAEIGVCDVKRNYLLGCSLCQKCVYVSYVIIFCFCEVFKPNFLNLNLFRFNTSIYRGELKFVNDISTLLRTMSKFPTCAIFHVMNVLGNL